MTQLKLDNYRDRLIESKNIYDIESVTYELCNELNIIIELLDIRYMHKLFNAIELSRSLDDKLDRIDTLINSLVLIGSLKIVYDDIETD